MEGTIGVTGTGILSVEPDTIQLILGLSETKADYGQAMEASTRATQALKAAFLPLGFSESDLKTTLFSIDSKYESLQDGKGNYKQAFVGYQYDHRLMLEFESDKDRLGQVLTALLKSQVAATFNLVYTIKDKEAVKEALLKRAVSDAKTKSRILAEAAGVKLGQLVHIAYGRKEINFRTEPMRGVRMVEHAVMSAVSADIEPQAIPLEETVRMVWKIQGS